MYGNNYVSTIPHRHDLGGKGGGESTVFGGLFSSLSGPVLWTHTILLDIILILPHYHPRQRLNDEDLLLLPLASKDIKFAQTPYMHLTHKNAHFPLSI